MENILVNRGNEQEVIISDVPYFPSTKLENKELKVFNENSKLILKAHMLNNMTFKIMSNMFDHQCLASTIINDCNSIRHQRYGHLIFRSLTLMHMNKIIHGLP